MPSPYTLLRLGLLLTLSVVSSAGTGAQFLAVTEIRVGEAAISLPAPVGFTETSRRSKELWSQALATATGDARLIAHFVTDKNLSGFESGSSPTFSEFAYVHTPRRAEMLTASQEQFNKLRSGTIALQADYSRNLEPRLAKEIARVSKSLSDLQGEPFKFKVGELVPVSVDRDSLNVLIYTVLAQLSSTDNVKADSQTMVMTTAYCYVRNKVVMLTYYRTFKSPRDLEASRKFVTQWSAALASAN